MAAKYYLTTPLYYVNSRPHLGHAYTEIAADALARWNRLMGRDVFFLTGTDEHGQKIARAALGEGMEPQAFADKYSGTFRDLWAKLGVKYDDFIRTTEPRHKDAVKKVWVELDKKGELYTSAYRGYYCTPCETFLTEESVRQMKAESKPVLCPDCSRPAEEVEETNYFFKLSKYQEWLTGAIEKGEIKILPETRKNEVLGFLKSQKLEDLCVSRPKNRLAWGIPTPLSADHVTYVWFDALVNYISACGYGSDEAKLGKWWPADVHLIGKDILRHHAVYWTILLKALGLPPPSLIFAHGWWTVDGKKMSKSLGNATDPVEITDRYGVDAFRFFLLSETPFGQDGTFSEDALILRINVYLANNLGNLLQRTLSMCEKYFEGAVPSWTPSKGGTPLLQNIASLHKDVDVLMRKLDYTGALERIWALVDAANKHIENSAPWALAKAGRQDELAAVIRTLLEALAAVAHAAWPFIPSKAEACWAQLGQAAPLTSRAADSTEPYFKGGEKTAKADALFPRIESEEEKAKKAAAGPKKK